MKFANSVRNQWHIITNTDCRDKARELENEYGIPFSVVALTARNYRHILNRFNLGPGDFLLDLSVCVGSKDLIDYCRRRGVLYLNTAVNPWAGEGDFYDPKISIHQRINYRYLEEL